MSTHPESVGELLITLLESYGVDTVFGIPGVHTIEMYRHLATSSIRHITPRHEQGAGFMADGYARASGKPGVCFCITGPGMTNIATAMGQAYADSIPMLVISSVNKTSTLGKGLGRLHELKDQNTMLSGVTAFSHTLLNAEDLPSILEQAFDMFSTARPRPVHIEIPIDLFDLKLSQQAFSNLTPSSNLHVVTTPNTALSEPDIKTINDIAISLANAEKSILLVGGGCINAESELSQLVETLSIPTCLTVNARGLLAPDHPLLLDGVQNLDAFREAIAVSDVCLAVGTELGETDYDFYDRGPLPSGKNFIRIDIDPQQLHTNVSPAITLCSDAKTAIGAINTALNGMKLNANRNDAIEFVQLMNSSLRSEFNEHTEQYEQLLANITRAAPNALIVGDSTKPIYHLNFVHRAAKPRHWFNSATGFGTLGYALPAAMGAKLSKPNSPVVAIAGDGGFQFTCNELMSAVQEGIAIAIVVWNNNAYREIQDFMTRANIEPVGVNVQGPNLQKLCESMGAEYSFAHTIDDIGNALAELSTNTPRLIEYVATIDA